MTADPSALRSDYRRDGYVVVPKLLDRAIVEQARGHLDRLRSGRPAGAPIVAVAVDRSGTVADDGLETIARDRRLTGLAELLLDGPVACFGCTYLVKAARTGIPALWHQDGHPWADKLGVTEAVTLWVALDPTDERNGALEMAPGTHALPAQPLSPVGPGAEADGVRTGATGARGGMFGGGLAERLVAEVVRPAEVRMLEMAPGDVSAHHPCLVHGSGGNRSGRERRALVVRYRPA